MTCTCPAYPKVCSHECPDHQQVDDTGKAEAPKRRYLICSSVTLGVYTEVVARSPEEAKAKAFWRGMKSLCHQCSHGGENAWREWCFGDGSNGDVDETDVEVIEE